MPLDAEGRWCPPIFKRQADLIQMCRSHLKRFVLATGPRLSGKSVGCLHAVMDHVWYTDPANVCIVTITQSAGYDSGIWTLLVETIIPQWVEAGFGMEWVKRPGVKASSKKPYCSVRNAAGRPVEIILESLHDEREVEEKFKGKSYSMMFVNELSNFRKRKTFQIWEQCFRMMGLADNRHIFLADTNPSDEGTGSWIYKLWFELSMSDLNRDRDYLDLTPEQKALYAKLKPLLGHIEFPVEDNIFASKERVEQLKGTLVSDPDLWARYIEGRWVTASIDAIFAGVFKENFHVIGKPSLSDRDTPETMTLQEGCFELITGWDPGTVNCAFVIIEKARFEDGQPSFKVLDELVIIDEDVSLDDFTHAAVGKMKFWEAQAGHPLRWLHYSDRSAFDIREPAGNRYHHQIIYSACPEDTPGGRIQLVAAARGRESVSQRVDLLRKLLWEQRIFFSAARTPRAIEMLKAMRRGRSTVTPIERGSRHKHVFDAIMYAVATECYDEIEQITLAQGPRTANSGFVAIPA